MQKIFIFLAVTLNLLLIQGCQFTANNSSKRGSYTPGTKIAKNITVGPWKNIYAGDLQLAGVVVQQIPESPEPGIDYSNGAHPSSITWIFWNGTYKTKYYNPNGVIFLENEGIIEDDLEFWNHVDFSYGSDPTFRLHLDPRR